jgi:hypothetical protein
MEAFSAEFPNAAPDSGTIEKGGRGIAISDPPTAAAAGLDEAEAAGDGAELGVSLGDGVAVNEGVSDGTGVSATEGVAADKGVLDEEALSVGDGVGESESAA